MASTAGATPTVKALDQTDAVDVVNSSVAVVAAMTAEDQASNGENALSVPCIGGYPRIE